MYSPFYFFAVISQSWGPGHTLSRVNNMEIDKHTDQLFVNDNEIILVAKHKTGLDKGPPKLVISDTEIKHLLHQCYINIRQHMQAANAELSKRFFSLTYWP